MVLMTLTDRFAPAFHRHRCRSLRIHAGPKSGQALINWP